MLTNSCVFVRVDVWISVAYRPAYGPAHAHASGAVYRRERRSLWGYGYGLGHIPENGRSGPQSSTQTSGLVMVSQSVLLTSHHRIQEPQPSLFFVFSFFHVLAQAHLGQNQRFGSTSSSISANFILPLLFYEIGLDMSV